jgi:transposase
MTRFIEGEPRTQSTLFPERLDDYVSDDNPVKAVDAFIEALDLERLGFHGMNPKVTGRPAYHPSTMLKIFLYGYLNRIQSSRRLERETQRNVELMWLTGRLSPDFKTLANFRKDNGKGIRQVCRQFIGLCRQFNLFSHAMVAIDGSKFKAVNNWDRNFTKAKTERRLQQIDESIDRYLEQIARADLQESGASQLKADRLQNKIRALKQEVIRLNEIESQMEEAEETQLSLTDPDARSMATTGRGTGVVG